MRLTVACVRQGTLYGPEYVERLFEMTRRWLTAEHTFACFTDQPETLPGVENRPLPEGVEGWWAKLAMFRSEAFSPGTRVLYFDLDTVIVGDLGKIAGYRGDLAALRDPYRPLGLCSAVLLWRAGTQDDLWSHWESEGRPTSLPSDQEWIERYRLRTADRLQDLYPGQFRSYKADNCAKGYPAGTRVVYFHGEPKPHHLTEGWVPAAWTAKAA